MKKGFTLIELLAVIVILAIIALIATPIVLSIIDDAKDSATFRNAEYYLEAVEQSIAKKSMSIGSSYRPNICNVQENGNLLCDDKDILEIEVNGEKPTSGKIRFDSGKMSWMELELSNKEIMLNPNTEELEYKLAPGMYDKDDNLLASWDELVNDYGLDLNFITDPYAISTQCPLQPIENAYKFVIDESITNLTMLNTFADCSIFKSVVIPSSLLIGQGDFMNSGLEEIIISDGVTSIGSSAFDTNKLTSVTIPSSVTSIGDYAFLGNKLTSLAIPSSVTRIGEGAFNDNRLPDDQAFIYARNEDRSIDKTKIVSYGGAKRDNVVIPSSVTTIDYGAFAYNDLTSITIPNSVTSIGMSAFENNKLTSITIPQGVKTIQAHTFQHNELKSVTIPQGVKTIQAHTFQHNELKSVTIPNSVTFIGMSAFYDNKLTSITIPESVTSIDELAFAGNDQLTTIYYKGTASGAPWGATSATVVTDF